jgi:hypothetical protein
MLIVAVEYDDICADVYFNLFNEIIEQEFIRCWFKVSFVMCIIMLLLGVWFGTHVL